MIEFLTLFLGLTGGPQLVAVDAGSAVAAVELRFSGELLARLDEPPWRFEVDFGVDLVPSELSAVAFDAEGVEIGRARQVLNLPRPPAEVRLLLDPGDDGGSGEPTVVRTSWESAAGRAPSEVTVFLDGEPLLQGGKPLEDASLISLEGVDLDRPHFLEVELSFGRDVSATAHLVFGGGPQYQTGANLTGFPVTGGRRLRPEKMTGWFHHGGKALSVVAVERGRADLVLVRGPGVEAALERLEGLPKGSLSSGSAGGSLTAPGGLPTGDIDTSGSVLGGVRSTATASGAERLRSALSLPGDVRLRMLLPHARQGRGRRVDLDSFAISPEITARMGGLVWALSQTLELPGLSDEVRVWDAVALAGLRAAAANRRRAVLLVVADGWRDESRYPAPSVVGYLDALRVPLYVWRVSQPDPGEGEGKASVLPEPIAADEIRRFSDMKSAARRLKKALDRQSVVWFDGVHLPNAIEVAPDAGVDPVTRP